MADLTPDLQVYLSWGTIAKSFHSLQSLSVSCFHFILGLSGPHFSSTSMSKAAFTPLECSTCPYQQSLLSFRSPDPQWSTSMSKAAFTPLECSTCPYQQSLLSFRSSMPSRASSSLDLVVTMSCGLSDHCPVISLQTLEVWLCQWPSLTGMEHWALHTRAVHAATCLERELVEALWTLPGGFHTCCGWKLTAAGCWEKAYFLVKIRKKFQDAVCWNFYLACYADYLELWQCGIFLLAEWNNQKRKTGNCYIQQMTNRWYFFLIFPRISGKNNFLEK